MDSFPIKECLHCKFDQAYQSVPQKDFKTNESILDKNGKVTGYKERIIKEISIVRGDKFEDVVGWTW